MNLISIEAETLIHHCVPVSKTQPINIKFSINAYRMKGWVKNEMISISVELLYFYGKCFGFILLPEPVLVTNDVSMYTLASI